jgi:transposase
MNSDLVHKIVALFRGGASMRRIARCLGVSPRSVKKALAEVEQARGTGPPPRKRAARGSLLDAYEPAIVDLLARYPDITAQRVHEELRPLGYTGGYTILSVRVRASRPSPVVAPVRRFETAPGEHYGKPGVMFSNAEGIGLPCPEFVSRFP